MGTGDQGYRALHGWLAGWRGSIGSRKAAQLCLLRPLRFGILVETVEHDELVLLPVAGFGSQWGSWPAGTQRSGVQAFLLLQDSVGELGAVRLLGTLWANQTLPVQGCIGGSKCRAISSSEEGRSSSLPTGLSQGMGHSGLGVQQRLGALGHTVVHVTPRLLRSTPPWASRWCCGTLRREISMAGQCTHWALAWHCRRRARSLGKELAIGIRASRSSSSEKGSC